MKKSLIACVLAFSCLSFAAQAHDDNHFAAHLVSLDVPYGDLNLANPYGAEVMLQRIQFAARKVCGGLPDIREIRERQYFAACVGDAVEGALAELRAPLVSSLYRQSSDMRFAATRSWYGR
jgi:UrcA family protein